MSLVNLSSLCNAIFPSICEGSESLFNQDSLPTDYSLRDLVISSLALAGIALLAVCLVKNQCKKMPARRGVAPVALNVVPVKREVAPVEGGDAPMSTEVLAYLGAKGIFENLCKQGSVYRYSNYSTSTHEGSEHHRARTAFLLKELDPAEDRMKACWGRLSDRERLMVNATRF